MQIPKLGFILALSYKNMPMHSCS